MKLLKKLFIFWTLVMGLSVFALDMNTTQVVRDELWSMYEAHSHKSQLNIQLEERWSEELEVAVKMLEEH